MTAPRWIIALLFPSLAILGCTSKEDSPVNAAADYNAQIQDIALNYKKFTRLTPSPVFVDLRLAMLCTNVTQQAMEASQIKYGPHANASVMIYMNDIAANAFHQSAVPYPVGSIIIKDKSASSYVSAGSTQPGSMARPAMPIIVPAGVGGMIKRPPGYDPDHGDWEYFYFETPASISSGKIDSCVQCHAGAAGKDHVFGNWASAQTR